jgi:site-specific recombinase XerD
MKQSAHPFGAARNQLSGNVQISVYDFRHWSESWVFDAQYRQCSKNTIENHSFIHAKVLWFCEHRDISIIDANALRRFFIYLREPKRWNNPSHNACQESASRSTVDTYHAKLITFFNWCVKQDYIDISPMKGLDRPLKSKRKIEPFTDEELRKIIRAAEKSKYAVRNTAAIHLLLGTGLRASEFCAVQCYSVDWDKRSIKVIGKGDKERVVRFGSHTRRLLYDYAKTRGGISGLKYLFLSEKGEPFTRWGITQLIKSLGVTADLKRDRICAHTFRHTFATKYLIDGGNVYALMELLGHETLAMTNEYVKFAQNYLELQHRMHAPDDALYR